MSNSGREKDGWFYQLINQLEPSEFQTSLWWYYKSKANVANLCTIIERDEGITVVNRKRDMYGSHEDVEQNTFWLTTNRGRIPSKKYPSFNSRFVWIMPKKISHWSKRSTFLPFETEKLSTRGQKTNGWGAFYKNSKMFFLRLLLLILTKLEFFLKIVSRVGF